MGQLENRHVLVIDDEPSMHQDFAGVLEVAADSAQEAEFSDLESRVFGTTAPPRRQGFRLASAHQGLEGLETARRALGEGDPFALAIVDMRMPPGWDGLRTAKELWALDPRLQLVFCTAYSPYSWDEALGQLEGHDRLLVVKKPFDPIEIWQAATTLCAKWTFESHAHAVLKLSERQGGV